MADETQAPAPAAPEPLTLQMPIRAEGREIRELVFRRLRAGDVKGVKISVGLDGVTFDVGQLVMVAARMANLPASALDGIEGDDLVAVVAAMIPLLPRLPGIGIG